MYKPYSLSCLPKMQRGFSSAQIEVDCATSQSFNLPTNERAPPAFSVVHAKQSQLTFSITADTQLHLDSHTQCLRTYRRQAATRPSSTRSASRAHKSPNPSRKLTFSPPQRNIPTRGLKPAYYLLGVGLVMAYGWRKLFIGNREKKYGSLRLTARTDPVPPYLTPLPP
jgi:hypothetical protein